MTNLLSRLTATTVGLACKAFLNLPGYNASVTVTGLPILLKALYDEERLKEGRGVITVANHTSTIDDPLAWGVLPTSTFLRERTTRWALGAQDIIFTNPVFSAFFRAGQTLETVRGAGVYQRAVDRAIAALDGAQWVHLFGEGGVRQPAGYAVEHGRARLGRFKWGVGRMVMETQRPPVVIPMWLGGFDRLMPEKRPVPQKFFPRRGQHLSVTFGEPIAPALLLSALCGPAFPADAESGHGAGWMGSLVAAHDPAANIAAGQREHRAGPEMDAALARVRAEVTAIVQREVEALGRRVAGELLGKDAV